VGALTLVGAGAGGDATASAVAADIADIARGLAGPVFGRPVEALVEAERASPQRHEGGYYVRLDVVDRPGAIGIIATRMGDCHISLEAVQQKRPQATVPGAVVPVVMITHATSEGLIREALEKTVGDGVVQGAPQVIRIERS
jgi:homoserine dehydrogenase